MTSTFIIAEAGANHDRKFEQALALIDAAVNAKADAVKFQTYSSNTLYSKNTPDFAGYANINKLIENLELPREWQPDLKKYCDEKGIEFMSTPFDEKAVQELVDLGVKRLKIAGFESTDPRFVSMVLSAGLPTIISLGIGSSFSGMYRILEIAEAKGVNDITFLHCNNAYPTPLEDVNIDTIKGMAMDSRYKTGFSDHTTSPFTPALAVTAGATVIEKHYTLSRYLQGPDHAFALEPKELAEMVAYIRFAEKCKGHKVEPIPSMSERKFGKAMRSVVAKRTLKAGEVLTEDNITTKRPFLSGSIPASDYYAVLGDKINLDIEEDSIIFHKHIS
jgi:N,N'-diacetyllegionaminate synthase